MTPKDPPIQCDRIRCEYYGQAPRCYEQVFRFCNYYEKSRVRSEISALSDEELQIELNGLVELK